MHRTPSPAAPSSVDHPADTLMEPSAARPVGSPAPEHLSVLVVGAGLAGAQTAAALRAHGSTGRITVLGAEGVAPYDRPPLSKELFTRTSPAWLVDETGADLDVLADETVLGDPAVALTLGADGGPSIVTTASGRTITADVVVLACGSEPVRPVGWDSATTLHTAADAEALRASLSPGRRLVCVGAGWIGAEVAGAAAAQGVEVTVVEAAPVALHRQLGAQVGALLAGWYEKAGVTLVTGVTVTSVGPEGVHVDHGTRREMVGADVVLAAVGARPATGWLAGTVPTGPRGDVQTDIHGRVLAGPGSASGEGAAPETAASQPAVWAVGDCATRADDVWGQVHGGHWSAALLDPGTVARSILGLETPPVPAPYVFSTQLGHDLALFGLPDPTADSVVLRGDPSTPGTGWVACYVGEAGTVTGILVVDSPRDVAAARRLMAQGPALLDLDKVADPRVPLKATAAATPSSA
ncbi:NAD(P)/FAD-dependent oxidoreductase [Sanguibacter inulinus]|nr:FAD-dependent oxidoreductase [Sanguibacter inulinus]